MNKSEDRRKELAELVGENFRGLFSPGNHKNFLQTLSRFPDLLLSNVIRTFLQFPDAHDLDDYENWKKRGRQVRANEHGITLLAPSKICYSQKISSSEECEPIVGRTTVTLIRWKPITVFDVTQTEGPPLPERPAPTPLPILFEAAIRVAPCPVQFSILSEQEVGRFSYRPPGIVLRIGQSDKRTVSTLFYELSCAALFDIHHFNKETVERLAPSIAFCISEYFGVRSEVQFVKLSDWSETVHASELHKALSVIADVAAILIFSINEKCRELQNSLSETMEINHAIPLPIKLERARELSRRVAEKKSHPEVSGV